MDRLRGDKIITKRGIYPLRDARGGWTVALDTADPLSEPRKVESPEYTLPARSVLILHAGSKGGS